MPSSSCTIPGTVNHLGIGRAAIRIHGQAGNRTNAGHAITPFMFNEEEYQVCPFVVVIPCVLTSSEYACDEDGVEYPSAHDFYCQSNTHDPDQDRFEDLYHRNFIHAISQVAHRKLARHRLDPYQRATFCHSIIRHNTGKEEANPTLELAMEYSGALSTIVFNESCRLRDLTEAQIGRNQFAMDVAMDRLDGEVDHASERISTLEGKVADLEAGYTELLALGREQVETSTQAVQGLGQLAMVVLVQQAKIRSQDKRMDAMREMILALEHTQANPIVVDDETAVSSRSGEELEIKENKVAIPIPVPGRLIPIKDKVQVLPDELVGTQIAFELANKDHPPSYE